MENSWERCVWGRGELIHPLNNCERYFIRFLVTDLYEGCMMYKVLSIHLRT